MNVARPHTAPPGSAEANGLYAETSGRGPPLVLLHGFGLNQRVFDPLRAGLEEHFTVTALDLPGHGRSAWIADQTLEQQLTGIAGHIRPGAILVGWSWGGQLALQLAADPALELAGLVLLASTPRFVSAPGWPHGMAPSVLARFAALLESEPRRTVDDFLELQVRGSAAADAVLGLLRQALSDQGYAQPIALAGALEQLRHNDLRALAREVSVPALVIAGEYDRITPPLAAQALAHMLPRGELLRLRRAGHAPFLSHPEQVLTALRALRDQVPS